MAGTFSVTVPPTPTVLTSEDIQVLSPLELPGQVLYAEVIFLRALSVCFGLSLEFLILHSLSAGVIGVHHTWLLAMFWR